LKNKKKPLLRVEVDAEDYGHLLKDDLDDISKIQVAYKILKQ